MSIFKRTSESGHEIGETRYSDWVNDELLDARLEVKEELAKKEPEIDMTPKQKKIFLIIGLLVLLFTGTMVFILINSVR